MNLQPHQIIQELGRNKAVFFSLLSDVTPHKALWRPDPDHWSLLEVVCHLYDEEREDFRTRVQRVLESPEEPLPPIRPKEWVISREYMLQDYAEKVEALLYQRQVSLDWLSGLGEAPWDNVHQHPKLGPMSARLFLQNWLAHDYIHIRQINRIHFRYLTEHTYEAVDYAGVWR